MCVYSHHAKFSSRPLVRIVPNETGCTCSYHAKVPRKSNSQKEIKPIQADWYLRDWMRSLRVSQARLAKECDWSPSTMHGIYHGRTAYYREIVNLIAGKLNIQPYELLMHPDVAFAFRRQRADALLIVEDSKPIRAANG